MIAKQGLKEFEEVGARLDGRQTHGGDVIGRRTFILLGGTGASVILTFSVGAIFGISYWIIVFSSMIAVITAAIAWPNYRSVSYWSVGMILSLALVSAALIALLVFACNQGSCL